MAVLVVIENRSIKEGLMLLFLLFPFCLEVSAYSMASNCTLPVMKGPCEAAMPRFFFNATSRQCEKFLYGGCGGNANNFYSLNECLKECKNESICTLPPVSGPCEAYSEQFYYNATTAKCEKLIYGGCGGNLNRFPTFLQCMMECGAPVLCHLPAAPGPCEAHMPSYFFNSSSSRCEKFIYGGCQGNDNRFQTVDECRVTCPDICTLPAVAGLCKAKIPSYYYNFGAQRCEYFEYGGCGGNANRFESERECRATCSGNAAVGSLFIGVIGFLAMVFAT